MRSIAVVGSGVAGLGAAWALSRFHDVTVFEAAATPGGHAHTVEVARDGGRTAVDTGFIVYNERNYPHLTRLFDALGVATEPSEMSFAASLNGGRLEYAGSPLGLFAQPGNLLRPGHWRMVTDTLRFFRQAPAILRDERHAETTLAEYVAATGYSPAFLDRHLLPMAAAIWSCPTDRIRDFPARSFVRFLHNHGLLLVRGRPRWRTVSGGSRRYVDRVVAAIGRARVRLSTPIVALRRDAAGVRLTTARGETARFDEVVLATHADQALKILGNEADAAERSVLGAFGYAANEAVLHGDPDLMPRRRRVWSSWNYLSEADQAGTRDVSVTYWMNRLQNLDGPPLFVSLNPLRAPRPETVQGTFRYDHPVFDAAAIAAQALLPEIQGVNRTWFCGSYCGYGFHEDGLEAGFAVAAALGAPVPWADSMSPASPAAAVATPVARAPASAAA